MDQKSSHYLTIHHMPSSLDTIWQIRYNSEQEPMLNFDQIFTPKGNLNICISSTFVATILLGICNTGSQAPTSLPGLQRSRVF